MPEAVRLSSKPNEAVKRTVESTRPQSKRMVWLGRRSILRRPMRNRMGLKTPIPTRSRNTRPRKIARPIVRFIGDKPRSVLFIRRNVSFLSGSLLERGGSGRREVWRASPKQRVLFNQTIAHRDQTLGLVRHFTGVCHPYKGQLETVNGLLTRERTEQAQAI